MRLKETTEEAAMRKAVEDMFNPTRDFISIKELTTITRILKDAGAAVYLMYLVNRLDYSALPFKVDMARLKSKFGFSISKQQSILDKLVDWCMLHKSEDRYTIEWEVLESYFSEVVI